MYPTLSHIPVRYQGFFTVFYYGEQRYFQVFEDPKKFISFYRTVPKSLRCYYEVIRGNIRKLIIDIDVVITEDEILELRHDLQVIIYAYREQLTFPIVFKSTGQKISYHLVVPDIEFTIEECKHIISLLDPEEKYCDRSVYKPTQLFRIEGSTKFGQSRYKYVLYKDALSQDDQDILAGFAYVKTNANVITSTSYTFRNTPVYSSLSIDNQFKIRKQVSPYLISLSRTSPGYCPICKRVHEHENAYLVYKDEKWEYRCFRN